ncbi:hypothetical protein DPMN_108478 [Dreissena polymorpha]|uniref:Uncharacterized protein n=1 Tax=Dreissena polymorpha TaxID=45954 RepID=A0A9D4K8X3_DREPO|nr:hypothetical protein DPMN_108478 [Dreissena polymorpha]
MILCATHEAIHDILVFKYRPYVVPSNKKRRLAREARFTCPGREHLEVKAASRKTWDGDARAVNPIEVMPYVDVNSLCIHCTEGGRRSCLMNDLCLPFLLTCLLME